MTGGRPVVICVSPHPDDELLGAPATLMALRDAGWRVVNLACSLGRPEDRRRRRTELTEACRLAGFELVIPERIPPIGRDDDHDLAQAAVKTAIAATLRVLRSCLVVAPSPHDGHHGHELVGRAVLDAIQAVGLQAHVMFWGLWSDLPLPNVLVPFGAARMAEIQRALRAHTGQLARNAFDRLVTSRASANAVLGPERVFGYGASAIADEYAELLTDVGWRPGGPWTLTSPRELDASDPSGTRAAPAGRDIGWWLHAPSARTQLSQSPSPPPARP